MGNGEWMFFLFNVFFFVFFFFLRVLLFVFCFCFIYFFGGGHWEGVVVDERMGCLFVCFSVLFCLFGFVLVCFGFVWFCFVWFCLVVFCFVFFVCFVPKPETLLSTLWKPLPKPVGNPFQHPLKNLLENLSNPIKTFWKILPVQYLLNHTKTCWKTVENVWKILPKPVIKPFQKTNGKLKTLQNLSGTFLLTLWKTFPKPVQNRKNFSKLGEKTGAKTG